jgi:arylformamidase
MKIIDLSMELYDGMPVYLGDPEVEIKLIQTFDKDAWNMRRLNINAHDGTHINFPIHGLKEGKNQDDYKLEDFIGESYLFETYDDIKTGFGIIFNKDITWDDAYKIAEIKPKFVGSWAKNDIDVDIEKHFFKHDILLYERLINIDKLPKKFMFYGMPLRIRKADGSPVRAFAIIE